MPELTQARLKELLHYNPDTGIFTWLESRGTIKIGAIACTSTSAGYIRISIDGKDYLAHRLVWLYMKGYFPPCQIDHEDHIRHHNWFSNLRSATDSDNRKNQSMRKNNLSGFTGVYWCKPTKKWVSQIKVNGKQKYLGSFTEKQMAISCREGANIKYGYHINHGK